MAEPGLAVETVLVPVDGSDEAAAAVDYAVAIADRFDAAIHVVYVLDDEVSRAVEAGELDPDDVAAESRAVFDGLVDRATDVGVSMTSSMAYGFSVTRKLVHPGSVILDCADQVDADFLVIPREAEIEGPAEVLERAAEYVLLYASQPVLSV